MAAVALCVTTVVVGLVPAWRLTGPDTQTLLGRGGRSTAGDRRSGRLLSGIGAWEIALSIALVASAGWLVRSYANLATAEPGFAPESRLVFRTALLGSSYQPVERIVVTDNGVGMVPVRGGETPETWLRDLTVELESIDQVRAVGLGGVVPFRSEGRLLQYVSIPGTRSGTGSPQIARGRPVSPAFFEAMGIALRAGRALSTDDPADAVVVNEAFARTYLDGADPIGLTFQLGFRADDVSSDRTIVGVVADARFNALREADPPAIYSVSYPGRGFVVISTTLADPTPLVPAIRAAVSRVDARVPVAIESLGQILADELARHRLGLLLMTLFAAVSVLLAGVGIYGIVAYRTSLRSSEFAVRMAVGADRGDLATSVFARGLGSWIVGTAVGLVLAYALGRVGSTWLYQVGAGDTVVLLSAATVVSLATCAATAVAAARASRLDPGTLLRSDA